MSRVVKRVSRGCHEGVKSCEEGGIYVGCEPIGHLLKLYMSQFLGVTISESRKALLILLCILECFADCW